MVETLPSQHFRIDSLTSVPKMPVDYTTYLLSSSPPGFEFCTLRDQFVTLGGHRNKNVGPRRNLQPLQTLQINTELNSFTNFSPSTSVTSDSCNFATTDSVGDQTSFVGTPVSSPKSPTSPSGKIKKKVSFADDLGFSLTMVKIMTEPSSHPPRLRTEFISSLTQGATASVAITTPPLVLNFSQPASNYLDFREKLERNCVSLENVILKDYNMIGTIKVKNIAYEKNVFVRVTFDSWESSTDVSANYVPGNGCGGGSAYDTFSFEISVPTNMDIKKKVQFVVCFEIENRQFWDNNSGQNYEVCSAEYKDPLPSVNTKYEDFRRTHDVTWSLYSNWNNLESSVPYW